jgi:hypothetical protein
MGGVLQSRPDTQVQNVAQPTASASKYEFLLNTHNDDPKERAAVKLRAPKKTLECEAMCAKQKDVKLKVGCS